MQVEDLVLQMHRPRRSAPSQTPQLSAPTGALSAGSPTFAGELLGSGFSCFGQPSMENGFGSKNASHHSFPILWLLTISVRLFNAISVAPLLADSLDLSHDHISASRRRIGPSRGSREVAMVNSCRCPSC